jgi:hypothetical protein
VLDILKREKETREAIDTITMYEESKTKTDDLFFKQFNKRFPEMVVLFHEKFTAMIEDPKWPEKPVVQHRVLVSNPYLTFIIFIL